MNLLEIRDIRKYNGRVKEGRQMKKHRFWAWAAVICMAMAIYTGYKHQ
ncbi:MAG: hypothetical protein K2N87_11530 [Eubacterium sp.]|nr:hypothetical protein [Eubacterium sp.]